MSKCQNINPSSADAAHIVVAAHTVVVAVAVAEADAPHDAAAVANHEGSTPKIKSHTISKTCKI